MTDIDHGQVRLVAQLLQIGQNLALPGRVERGERLVEEEEPGAHQERAAEGDALALPTRELPRPPIEQVPDVEQIQDARRFGAVARKPAHAAAGGAVRRNAPMREQAAFLKDITDAAAGRGPPDARG